MFAADTFALHGRVAFSPFFNASVAGSHGTRG